MLKASFTDLLNEVNCRLEIKAEVNELPVNALASILILFEDEHCVVEQLLKLLIRVVDAQLFKRVELQHIQLQPQLQLLTLILTFFNRPGFPKLNSRIGQVC